METNKSISARQWWLSHRAKYNVGLLYAGFIAFLLYVILGPIIIEPHEEFEETIFEVAFQGFAYIIMMAIANAFYTLGWIVDAAFNKRNSLRFRERLFALGYWFSCALPILLIMSVMVRFLIWGK
ncbi:hypothetical protein NAF17_08880 [Mucilaginibacter sp. RB4R14]|uniref:hypothetical protein n=1 Tax=Mucilaginibacter aurantiaciroseus TaxID=2949308 RepID=UPI002090109B|nr:hypothetical protein [Mucilaginibacter aurantiaciroseus]MCO5935654.1 hypothetical protein [Mucilaginibacter aurantiaciroseus]